MRGRACARSGPHCSEPSRSSSWTPPPFGVSEQARGHLSPSLPAEVPALQGSQHRPGLCSHTAHWPPHHLGSNSCFPYSRDICLVCWGSPGSAPGDPGGPVPAPGPRPATPGRCSCNQGLYSSSSPCSCWVGTHPSGIPRPLCFAAKMKAPNKLGLQPGLATAPGPRSPASS